ncbi:MAG: DUF2314 domain-containing protein [Gemmataceae bacterium]|nr:DUF2314 domain-containing protein [Gemmataceae bacterium]
MNCSPVVRHLGTLWPLALTALFALAGCGRQQQSDNNVINVASSDAKMNAAIDKARSTVAEFIAALRSPKPGQTGFSVKMAFTDRGETEHMWLASVRFDGQVFRGHVSNSPKNLSNVKAGDAASVARDKISDWMFTENRKLKGGYTIRVLRDAMPAAERERFDKNAPFVID